MTEINQAIASGGPFREGGEAALEVGGTDVLLALVTFTASLAVLGYGLSAFATLPIFVLLHLAVLVVPALFVRARAGSNGDVTVPVLLLVATFATGPVGAGVCRKMPMRLWRRRPRPDRLRIWYD